MQQQGENWEKNTKVILTSILLIYYFLFILKRHTSTTKFQIPYFFLQSHVKKNAVISCHRCCFRSCCFRVDLSMFQKKKEKKLNFKEPKKKKKIQKEFNVNVCMSMVIKSNQRLVF